MPEIKSTLDLVMQRTQHLSLSQQERDAQREAQFLKKLIGRVQQFEDGQLRIEEVERDIGRLQKEHAITELAPLRRVLAERLDLDRDNRAILDLLQRAGKVDASPIVALLQKYRAELANVREAARKSAQARLAENFRISGSAVVALPEGAPDWQQTTSALRAAHAVELGERLKSIVDLG